MQISTKSYHQNYQYVLMDYVLFTSMTTLSFLEQYFITGKVQPEYQRVSSSHTQSQDQVTYLLCVILFLSLTLSTAASTLPRIPGYQGEMIFFDDMVFIS